MKLPDCCPVCQHKDYSLWKYKADGVIIIWFTCNKCGNHWKEEQAE